MSMGLPAATLTATDLFVTASVGLILFFVAILALRARDVKRLRRRLERHVPVDEGVEGKKTGERGRTALAGLFAATERAFGGLRLWGKLTDALERADSRLEPAKFFYVMLGSGLLLSFFFSVLGVPGALLLFLFPLGALIPFVVIRVKAGRRQKAFEEQLPQLLMTMAATVRVGHSFRAALQAVVKEGDEPASKEFGRVLLETDFGRPVDQALTEMARRLGSRNFEYVINAVTIQREVGGSLADLFDMVAETVRQRQQFTAKVRALTAMGRVSAYVLVAMPFVAVALLSAINSTYTAPLFTTSTGHLLIAIALGGMAIGSLILKKIVSFKVS